MKTFYAAIAALSITPATFAATTVEFDAQGEGPETFLISKGKVLMRSGENEDMVYDDRKRQMTMIDHSRRGYFVMDPEKMAAQMQGMQSQMQGQMGAAMEQMKQHMQTLLDNPDISDEQKKMIQDEMAKMSARSGAMPTAPGAAPEPMKIKATGKSRKVAGINCKMHRVSRGGRTVQEVCVASRKATGMPKDDYQTMQNMFSFMREIAEKSMSAMGMSGGGGAAFPEIDGVPVEIKDMEDGTVSVLRNVSTKSIADSTFSVPAGYREHNPFQ